jgi:hypothetical protein
MQPLPPCPKCNSTDSVDEEDQSGSSDRWFVCESCGCRYRRPPTLPPAPPLARPSRIKRR